MEKKTLEHRASLIEAKLPPSKSEATVNDYNRKIKNFVERLDDNISLIVKGHENDFLSAYQTIMNQIKIQMSKLRQNSDDQTAIVKNDQAVRDLQATLAWYQNEAVKLSDACSRLQSRYDKVKTKIQNYTIENSYLEQQTKMLIRQNQTLKANLQSTPENSKIETGQSEEFFKLTPLTYTLYSKYNEKDGKFLKALERFVKKTEIIYKRDIDKLDYDINEIKKSITEISAVQSKSYLRKNENEELFLECVDEMRKEIIRKKAKSSSIKRAGVVNKDCMMLSEREKLVESFVTNEEIISFLYDRLFGAKKDSDKIEQEYSSTLGFVSKYARKTSHDTVKSEPKAPIVVKGKLMISR